jgi:ABC-type sugar transport system ATPase subunit
MAPILVMEGVNKQYPGVKALDNVTFSVEQGEVRALLGKNGAGKSTLVKILSGAVEPDTGTIRIDGDAVRIQGPRDAFELGICTVYQEMSLVPGLTAAENILLGRWPTRRRLGVTVIRRR